MDTGTTIVAILGAATGLAAVVPAPLLRLIIQYCVEPRLRIDENYAQSRLYHKPTRDQISKVSDSDDVPEWRRFVHFEARSRNKRTALRCIANARIVDHPPQVKHLHEYYPLHWADVEYSEASTGAQPISIYPVWQRLDVVFTGPRVEGAQLAVPLALTDPRPGRDSYLPPGQYIIEVIVSCENGKADSKTVAIESPHHWECLSKGIEVKKKRDKWVEVKKKRGKWAGVRGL